MLERRPLYEQVRQRVLEHIAEHDLQPGDSIPTEAELADRYEVSVGTVRRALRQLVDQGILYRQPGRGTFLTEQSQARVKQRGFLACIVPYIRDAFASTVIAGAQHAAQEASYTLLLHNSYGRPDLEEEIIRQTLGSADGILLLPVGRTTLPSVLEELLQRHFPLVFMDRLPTPTTEDVNCVTSDNQGGAYAAVEHLIELGHHRIGLALTADAETNSSVAQRAEGYRQALQDHELAVEEALVVSGLNPRREITEGGETEDMKLLQESLQREKPSALFAVNDLIAIEAWRAAEGLGLSIPNDLSIVGFDDTGFLGDLGIPLTTMAQDAFEIGQKAVELAIEFIEERNGMPRPVVLPTHLVIRESTKPAA
ncbi:MAG: GntR family transcriptional regulator [Chloroflexota bacterium]|nr:GntR family transcriptional regulator [Chloroflexota bacterium]